MTTTTTTAWGQFTKANPFIADRIVRNVAAHGRSIEWAQQLLNSQSDESVRKIWRTYQALINLALAQ